MQKITTVADVKVAIQVLEYEQEVEWTLLKEQFHITAESLKPMNVLKRTFKDVTTSSGLKNDLLGAAVGLTAGYLSKAVVVGISHNPIKKILGMVLQLGVSSIVAKNPDSIKSIAANIMNFFTKPKEPKLEEKL